MYFKIEIDDFWLSEDDELEPALKNHIITSAVVKIKKEIEEKVDKLLMKQIGEAVEQMIAPVIDEQIVKFIEEGVVRKPKRYSSDDPSDPIPLTEYITELFMAGEGGRSGWSAKSHIEGFCKGFGEEMKLQYNAAFANQIVMNLKEQGMLKDEVVNALLTGPTKS